MAPSPSRQVLVWSLPTLAFLLTLLWYRRKRAASLRSDPGGTSQNIDSTVKDPGSGKTDQCASIPQTDSKHIGTCNGSEKPNSQISVKDSNAEVASDIIVEPVLEDLVIKSIANPSVNTSVPVVINHFSDDSDTDKEESRGSSLSLCTEVEIQPQIITADKTETLRENSISEKLEQSEYIISSSVSEEETFKAEEKAESAILEKNLVIVEPTVSCTSEILFESSSSVEAENTVQEIDEIESESSASESSTEDNSEESQTSVAVSQMTLTPTTNQTPEELFAELQVSEEVNLSTTDSARELHVNHNCEGENSISLYSQQTESDGKPESSSLPSEKREVGEVVSSSNFDSLSVTMARISSKEAPSMEKHSHEDENNKKVVMEGTLQNAESVSLECKLSSLELDANPTGEASSDVDSVSTNGAVAGSYAAASEHQGTERDSANHSPADVMLASPSISSYSDEGSSDSGKGCSDVATPPSRTPASGSSLSGDVPVPSVYEFVLPQHLVGRLIGRHGSFVYQIKAKTNASILIKRHPDTPKLKICAVEGTQADIDSALEMIRQKFPVKRYPSVTLEQVSFLPPVPTFPLVPEFLQLHLVEGVNNDVILSSLVSTGHFFLQQPTHPTFPALNRLNGCMNMCYSEPTAPLLPMPTQAGVICVAPAMGGWYRAQVVAADPESDKCDIKFVDYGGYMTVDCSMLRQIRSDFMTLPFQAAECYLANVAPVGGEEEWGKESYAGMEELTHGQVLQAQICTYAEDGFPVVYLYAVHDSQVVLVNHELVARGLAEWVEPSEA